MSDLVMRNNNPVSIDASSLQGNDMDELKVIFFGGIDMDNVIAENFANGDTTIEYTATEDCWIYTRLYTWQNDSRTAAIDGKQFKESGHNSAYEATSMTWISLKKGQKYYPGQHPYSATWYRVYGLKR